jgi:hypothetical protein
VDHGSTPFFFSQHWLSRVRRFRGNLAKRRIGKEALEKQAERFTL